MYPYLLQRFKHQNQKHREAVRGMDFQTKTEFGITESKLDNSVTDKEININGYSIIRNDRNRNGGGVACYIRDDLCFNKKNIFSNSIEHIFFEILIPKVKPIAIGIFYRPPNSNDFLDTLSNNFQQIDSKKNEIYLLGDFIGHEIGRNSWTF